MKKKIKTKNLFIFHGTEGYPEENWFPWLKEKLEQQGCGVTVPQFPTPKNQKLEAWLKIFKPFNKEVGKNTIFVGHSLGGVFLLRLLERLKKPIRTAFFIGTPIGIRPLKNYEGDKNFSGFKFDWKKIKNGAKNFVVYQSNNDPFVPLENGKQLAKNLGIELTFIPNAGHFNAKAGYTKFDGLLNSLQNHLT